MGWLSGRLVPDKIPTCSQLAVKILSSSRRSFKSFSALSTSGSYLTMNRPVFLRGLQPLRERENKELRRANEILKVASAFFVQAELDRRVKS
jgi:hypothetical protein